MTNLIRLKQIETGSLTEPNWNSISGIPSGIVSQSTDLSSLNQFTASYFTDSASVDSKILTESGRIDAILSASNANVDTFVEVVNLINSVDLTNDIAFASFYTSSNAKISSIEITTGSLIDRLNTIENVSGSWVTENETGSFLTSLNGAISGAGQILDLGFVTGSYTTINEFNSLTQSFNTISQSVTTISGNIGDVDFNGIISGSSQLTSSFDERYTLSGSIQPLPNGLISGSSQITSSLISDGFPTTSSTDILSNKTLNNPLLGSFRITSDGSSRMNTYGNNVEFFSNDGFLLNPATDRAVYIDSYDNQNKVVINSDLSEYATTGSNIFNGNQTITGSLSVTSTVVNDSVVVLTGSDLIIDSGSINVTGSIVVTDFIETTNIQGTGSLYLKPDVNDSRDFRIYNTDPSDIHLKGNAAYSFFGDDTNYLKIDDNNNEITLRANSTIILETGNGDIIFNPDSGLYKGSANAGNALITDTNLSGIIGDTNVVNNSTGNTITDNLTNIINSIPSIDSLNSFTQSIDDRVDSLENETGSYATTGSNTFNGNQTITGSLIVSSVAVVNGGVTIPTGSTITLTSGSSISVDSTGAITGSLTGSVFGIGDVSAFSSSVNSRINNIVSAPAGTISGSSQLTSSFDTRYAISASYLTSLNGALSSSTQVLGGSGIYSSSAQLPSGIVSGSSQLTSSFDTRYTLSGSVVSGTTPAGTISGSSQLTSSFDGRYTQTGSFNSLTASFNSFTASAQSVTTGSNSFNGTQTITGSLIISTGSFIGSQITANTASLYLTSGSNMYVQNNGLVEVTGSLKVSGSASFNVNVLSVDGRSGDEGGEINLAIPVTNTTLENRVATDVFQNRYRIFEGSSNAKGVYIDLSKAPNGVGGELMWKASGFVDKGVDVTLGNLKARISSSGNVSLQLSTISGTYSVYGSDVYSFNGIGGGTLTSPLSITTTPTYLNAGHNFTVAGATDTWIIMDTSAGISWRITMIIGASYLNNFISIERLH